MSQEQKTSYKFNILHDDVASEDLFENKTHAQVSENLFQLICSSGKGMTIGVEGGWGAGKSTVINLLKHKLEAPASNQKTLFFMFDAWAHDGDPLRRIFLESLIKKIDSESVDENLNSIREKITGRKKRVITESRKTVSKLGKWLSYSAFLLPLGSALFGKTLLNQVELGWRWPFPWTEDGASYYWLFNIGLFFLIFPIIILVVWFFFGEKDKITKKRRWDFFTTESTENSTQDVTEESERTSIEFEEYFKIIIEYTILKKNFERIVLVIDNLDRVDSQHAKNIWATLQTFFQKKSINQDSKKVEWQDRLWFIMPFDHEGFVKIWESTNGNSENSENSIAQSFLRKCFQIIVEVPTPVMSSWPEYAKHHIESALSEWPENEKQNVFDTFIRYASRLDKSPTPRDIKILINQIGMLGMRWGATVSSQALCLYAQYRQKYSENQLREELLKEGLPDGFSSTTNPELLKMEIAGLLFGVPKEKGAQLLLGSEIQAAIKSGEEGSLKTLATQHNKAFWIAWHAKQNTFIPTIESSEEDRILATNTICKGLGDFHSEWENGIKALITTWKSTSKKWDLNKFDYSSSIKNILLISSDKKSLLSWFENCINNNLTYATSTKNLSRYSEIIAHKEIDKFLINLGKIIGVAHEFELEIRSYHYNISDVHHWATWSMALTHHNLSFPFVLPSKEIVQELVSITDFSQDNLQEDYLKILCTTLKIYPYSSDWIIIVNNIVDEIIIWGNLSKRKLGIADYYELMLDLMMNQTTEIREKIKSYIKTPQFWNTAQSESSEEISLLLFIFVAISLNEEGEKPIQFNSACTTIWSDEQDNKLCESTYKTLSKIGALDSLWLLAQNSNNKFAIQIIKKYSDDNLFDCPIGVIYLDKYQWASENELSDITRKFCEGRGFIDAIPDMENDQLNYASIFKVLQKHGDTKAKEFVKKEISEMSQEQWLKCLDEDSDLLYCAISANHKYSNAFTQYFTEVLDGTRQTTSLWGKFGALIKNCCDVDSIVIPKLLDSYLTSSEDLLTANEFENLFLVIKDQIKQSHEQLIMQRIVLWIDSKNLEKLNIFVKHNIKFSTSPLQGLISRIEEELKSSIKDNENKDILKQLSILLNLDLTSPDEIEDLTID